MEVPRLGVKLELQLPAYVRATATQGPSRVYNLHHSSRQRWIVNPLSKVRDRTRNLMVPSQIRDDGNSENYNSNAVGLHFFFPKKYLLLFIQNL